MKEKEILKETQAEMRMQLKNSMSQFETTGKHLINRMNEVENRISRLNNKVEELDHSSQDYEKH